MNVETETEAAQFPGMEYINGILLAVCWWPECCACVLSCPASERRMARPPAAPPPVLQHRTVLKKSKWCLLLCTVIRFVWFSHKVRTYKEYHSVCPSLELGLPPTPHPQASVPPPPCFWGEGNTRWRERGWESPNSDEGHTLWYSLYVRTLWI